jgi:hypothetical protein
MARDRIAHRSRLLILAGIAASACLPGLALAQTPSTVHERLDATSTYTRQDCVGPCACVSPPYTGAIAGTFTLQFNHADTWTSYYDIVNADLTAPPFGPGGSYGVHYTGSGTYEIGGDFAYTHRMVLDLIGDTSPQTTHHFESGYALVPADHPFPRISIDLTTGVLGCTDRTLHLDASPAPCAADFNNDGGVSTQDIFDFINAWFAGDPRADVNGGGLSVTDILDYLTIWFTGC